MCGNGIVEGTEECDCGSNSTCKSNDPCCKIGECLLESNATCRYKERERERVKMNGSTYIVHINMLAVQVNALLHLLTLSAVEEMSA